MKRLKILGWSNFGLFWLILPFWIKYPSTLTLAILCIPVVITIVLMITSNLERTVNRDWLKNVRRKKLKKLNRI